MVGPAARRSATRALFKIATLFVACALGFGLIEFGMRYLMGEDAFVESDLVDFGHFYLRPPNTLITEPNEQNEVISFRTDQFGLRRHSTPAPAASQRILVLGDSFVEAANTPDEETFTETLERELRSRTDSDLVVINGGVWGYSNVRSFFLMEHLESELKPTMVILMAYLGNDLRDSYKASDDALAAMVRIVDGDPTQPTDAGAGNRQPGLGQRVRKLAARSYLLTYLFRSANRWGDFYFFELETFRNDPAPEVRHAIERTGTILGLFSRYCEDRGIELRVAGIPSKAQVYEEFTLIAKSEVSRDSKELALDVIRDERGYSFGNPSAAFRRACDAVGVPYFDLLPAFREESRQDLFYKVDRHWKAPAQRLTARQLADWIVAQ